MEKMKCDIIQDLIPSYVDEICSNATRECVEEHIKICKECEQMVVLCRDHAPSGKKLEQKGLDGLKKIKQIMQLKGLVCLGLALFLLLCLGFNLFVSKNNVLSDSAYMVMMIACMILMLLSGMGYSGQTGSQGREESSQGREGPSRVRGASSHGKKESSHGKGASSQGRSAVFQGRMTEYVMGIVSCAICIYICILNMGAVETLLAGKTSFWGMELMEVGPFVERHIIIGFVICIVFLAYTIFRIIKYGKEDNWLLCLLVMNSFLLFQYELWLGRMDSPETIAWALIYKMVQTIFIGGLGIVFSILTANYFKKKMQGI